MLAQLLAGLRVADSIPARGVPSLATGVRPLLLLAETPSGRVHGYGVGIRREYLPVEGRQAGGDSVTLTIQNAGSKDCGLRTAELFAFPQSAVRSPLHVP